MKKNSLIYVADHKTFIGSALVRKLKEKGYKNLLLPKNLDLILQKAVETFFKKAKPEYVFLPSARSGGIQANINFPAEFIYQNTQIQTNIINAAFRFGVRKLLFLGSACSYPKICRQPIKEEYLLTGPVEKTSEPFAIAMIGGIKMCESYNRQYKTNFIAAIPTNAFGPGDDFSESGHVIAGLIRKFHKAAKERPEKAEVRIWGTGKPKREFLYVDDLAEACLFLMRNYKGSELINIAGGKELSIEKLAGLLQKIAGFKGKIIYETEKPDGMLCRALDSGKIFKLGWRPKIKLEQGLKLTYQWYQNYAQR